MDAGQTWAFTHEGVEFEMEFGRSVRRNASKARMYVSLPEDDDDSILDNIAKRDRGDKSDWQKARRTSERNLALAALDTIKMPVKFRYSAKAGCTMCPCSPGFILDAELHGDLWVRTATSVEEGKLRDLRGDVSSAKYEIKGLEKKLKVAKRDLKKAERSLSRGI
jgi:hypothetical protein